MKLVSLSWHRFHGKTPGARHAHRTWASRQGFHVLVADDVGRVGQGEALPLPGYSPDDLDAVERALAEVKVFELSVEPEALVHDLSSIASPSARFAVETAVLDVIGQGCGVSLGRLLGPSEEAPRPVAQLVLADTPHEIEQAIHRGIEAGYTTFKLKVGAEGRFDHDRLCLEAARRALPAGGRLRADANGGYGRGVDDDELWARIEALASLELEWLEEPAPASRMVAAPELSTPIAFDESMVEEREYSAIRILWARQRVAAMVLKPAILGGLTSAIRVAMEAARFGVPSIVSHLFDGPIAYTACAALACGLSSPRGEPPAHGLGLHVGLEPWPHAHVPFAFGTVMVNHAPGLGLARLEPPSGVD